MSKKKKDADKSTDNWAGISFRISNAYLTKDKCWRVKLYVFGLDGKLLLPKHKQFSPPVGGTKEDLKAVIQKKVPGMVCSCANLLIQQARDASNLALSLESYAALRRNEIQLLDKWAEKRRSTGASGKSFVLCLENCLWRSAKTVRFLRS